MAFVDQSKKAIIANALKQVMPHGWKYSLAVEHHMTLVLTIVSAPIDLINECLKKYEGRHLIINCNRVEDSFVGEVRMQMNAIVDAMNTGNHNRSDTMTDYFDVGHYITVQLGRWDKPFVVIAALKGKIEHQD